jgi:hypothetical protein
MERVGAGAIRSQVDNRRDAALATLLLRISAALIRTPHQRLGGAIDDAIAEVAGALAADCALVARRESRGVFQQHLWERGRRNGSVHALLGHLGGDPRRAHRGPQRSRARLGIRAELAGRDGTLKGEP